MESYMYMYMYSFNKIKKDQLFVNRAICACDPILVSIAHFNNCGRHHCMSWLRFKILLFCHSLFSMRVVECDFSQFAFKKISQSKPGHNYRDSEFLRAGEYHTIIHVHVIWRSIKNNRSTCFSLLTNHNILNITIIIVHICTNHLSDRERSHVFDPYRYIQHLRGYQLAMPGTFEPRHFNKNCYIPEIV